MSSLDGWKHCPRCASALEVDDGKAECASCDFRHYAASNATATALCVDDAGRILLTRRAAEVFHGYWDLPGGFVEEGEHPLDALRRELREETALEIEPDRFVGIWMDTYSEDDSGPSTMNLYWTARVLSGELAPADDVSEAAWFDPDALPPGDQLAFHVAEVLAVWRDEHA